MCYALRMADPLSLDDVRHVAKLARLRIDDAHLEEYRRQLSAILDHIAMIQRLDVEGVEPMAHPLDISNRLGADEPVEPMPLEALHANAPSTEGRFLAVPKVLDDGGDA